MTDGAHLCAKALSAWVENCLSQPQILNNGCCFTVTSPPHRCAMCITVQNKFTCGWKSHTAVIRPQNIGANLNSHSEAKLGDILIGKMHWILFSCLKQNCVQIKVWGTVNFLALNDPKNKVHLQKHSFDAPICQLVSHTIDDQICRMIVVQTKTEALFAFL